MCQLYFNKAEIFNKMQQAHEQQNSCSKISI